MIKNKVYDVTEFKDHPGGYNLLVEASGSDATESFNKVGHSPSTVESLSDYMIGFLADEDRDDADDKVEEIHETRSIGARDDISDMRSIGANQEDEEKEKLLDKSIMGVQDEETEPLLQRREEEQPRCCGGGNNSCNSGCPIPWVVGGLCLAGICYVGFRYFKKR